jgi:hypothetical protein
MSSSIHLNLFCFVTEELAFSEDAQTPFQTRPELLPFVASLIQPFVSTIPVRSSWLDMSRFPQSIRRCCLLRIPSSSNLVAAKPIRSNSKSPQSLLSPTSKQRKLQQQMQQKLSLLESNSHKFGPGGEGFYKQCVALDSEPSGLPSNEAANIQSALSFSNIGMWKLIHSQANALMASVDVTSISSLKRWLLICEGFCVVLQPVFFDEPLCLMLAIVDSPPTDIQQQLSIHNSSSSSSVSDVLTARNVMPTIQVDSTYQRVDPLTECFSMSVNLESMKVHKQQNDTWSKIHHYTDLLTLQLHSWTDNSAVAAFLGVPSPSFTLSSIAECMSSTYSSSNTATAPVRRASRARVPALPQAADTVIPAPPPPKPADPWAQVTTSTQAAASAVAVLAAGSSAPLPPNPAASISANPRARRYHATEDAKLDDAAAQLPRAPAPPSVRSGFMDQHVIENEIEKYLVFLLFQKPSSRRNSINNIATPADSSDASSTALTASSTVVPALKLPVSHLSLTDTPDSLLSMLHPQAPESSEEILFNRRLSAASTGQRASALPPLQK